MLFCDPDVIEAIWICGGKLVEAGPRWHTSGDRHDTAIVRGCGDHLSSEERCVVRSFWRRCLWYTATLPVRICWDANLHLRQCCAVEGDRIRFSRTVPTTLLRPHMHDHRTWHGEGGVEGLLHLHPVMAIKNANIGDAEILEETSRLLHE